MTTHDFSQHILENKKRLSAKPTDETAIKDMAQLISGSLVYRLYENLIANDYDMDAVTEHFEMLCDTQNHIGLLYFVFILCDAVDEALPKNFESMTANSDFAPYLSAAILEDWFDFHGDYEI